MPDYSFIARGLPPIDIASPLMQVEQIRQQRAAQAMQQQRNDLFAAQQKRQDEIFAQEQQDRLAQQGEAERKRQAEGALAVVQTLRQQPYAQLAADGPPPPEVAGILQQYGIDPTNEQTWNQSLQRAELQARASLGVAPDGPGTLYEIVGNGGAPVYAPASQAIGQQPYVKPSSPAVSLTLPGDNEWSKELAKSQVKAYTDITEAAKAADGKLARLDRMDQLLQGVETGRLAPARAEVAALAESLGYKIDPNLDDVQAFDALANEMALQMRNPSGGAGMPGAMSDKDREFLQKTVPGLNKTKGGNRLIIETGRALAKRDKEVAFLAREYVQKKGRLDEGFYDELAKFANENPMFSTGEGGGGQQGQPVRVNSAEEAWKLPSGTPFITPDGRYKVRP